MNRLFQNVLLVGMLGITIGCGSFGPKTIYTGPTPLYTQCHLKVLKPGYVTWENWTGSASHIPAGTPVLLQDYSSKRATFTRQDTNEKFLFDFGVGSTPDHSLQLLYKYFGTNPPAVDPGEFQGVMDQLTAKVGMNKEQVYYSMGPPAWAGEPPKAGNWTHAVDRSGIMPTRLWVYKRRTFGKNIGIEFDNNGIVIRTEGIW